MSVKTYIHQLENAYRERVFMLLVIRLAWLFLALVLLYIVLDAVFAFAGSVRLTLDVLALVGLVACVAWSIRSAYRSRAHGHMLVRLIEDGNPALENTLTNALDFDERLESVDGERLSRALMEKEIDRASEQVVGLENYEALTPPTLKREGGLLGGLFAALLIGGLVFHAVFFAVIPRYLLPFGDFPPYSAIHFAVVPGTATVDYGENLKIEVVTTNRIPDALTLLLFDEDGAERGSVEMRNAGDGQFFQTLENLRSPFRYLVQAERGRTRAYSISLNTVPRIEEVVVEYTYPAYTNLDPETRILSEDLLKGYLDTQVTMSIRSNRPLQGGEAQVNGENYIFATGPEENIVTTTFPLKAAGTYTASILDIDGNAAENSLRGKIEITEDTKPEVAIATPGMDSFAVPDSDVPILVDASDDLGIADITIYRRHNEASDDRKSIYEDPGRESFVTVDETLQLKDLGVKPGDTIDYYVTATDSRPGAPQTATSEMFRLLIISYDEYREYAQGQMTAQDLREKYEAIQDEMAALAETQQKLMEKTDALKEKLEKEGALSESEQDELEQAEMEQAALAEEAGDLAKRLEDMADRPSVFDIEDEYKEALRDFAERLAQANEAMKEASEEMNPDSEQSGEAGENPEGQESPDGAPKPGEAKPGQPSPEQLARARAAQEEALKQLAENMEQFEEGIQQANENLERVANVMADMEEFKYLYSLQKSLERSIGYYKNMTTISPEDQTRIDELSAQQQTVLESLAALKEGLRLHADELDALAAKQKGNSDVFIEKK